MDFDQVKTGRLPIKAWTRGVSVDEQTEHSLQDLTHLPFLRHHVAAMPDLHSSTGGTVGCVLASQGAVIPASVGVDIGCGVVAQRTTLTASDLPDDLRGLRCALEARIPHGSSTGNGVGDRGIWSDVPPAYGLQLTPLLKSLTPIRETYPQIAEAAAMAPLEAGTLGSGNHFVEICLDEEQRVWLMLHSGSRGIGERISTTFIAAAKEEMRRRFIHLPDEDLAYLPEGSVLFEDYIAAVGWAQAFARKNRALMMDAALDTLAAVIERPFLCDRVAIDCHHNYVAYERHFGDELLISRKGAIAAQAGKLGIICGSMGAKSFIVRGKGNADSFCSCSHGAGRSMSRSQALGSVSLEEHVLATAGVECRKDKAVLSESPAAYKDIDAVIAAQASLVEVVHTLKQVVCVKG